jgi:hypothetical protein
MAKKKQPDYGKAAKEASVALTKLKIKQGALHGFYLGSGDRAESISRLRRWVEIAAEHLSGDERGAWPRKWEAELMEDKRAHTQVQ